jgi:hypothetical protein
MNCSNCFHINFYHVKLMCSLNFELPCMIADFDSTRLPITYCYLFYYFKLYPGLTNSAHFAEIRRIRSSQNSKIDELLFINSKKLKNKKIRKKYVQKLDEILRLLVKNFFFKSASFGWLKFKFRQICTNGHQILIFSKFTKYKK